MLLINFITNLILFPCFPICTCISSQSKVLHVSSLKRNSFQNLPITLSRNIFLASLSVILDRSAKIIVYTVFMYNLYLSHVPFTFFMLKSHSIVLLSWDIQPSLDTSLYISKTFFGLSLQNNILLEFFDDRTYNWIFDDFPFSPRVDCALSFL